MKARSVLKGNCIVQSFGDYASSTGSPIRSLRANPHDQVVWVACHMNAGQGNYRLVLP